jgi:hypothetical protein
MRVVRAVIGLILFSSATLQAAVLFDNGMPAFTSAHASDSDFSNESANLFSLSQASLITDFQWWGVYAGQGPSSPPANTDNFTIGIFAVNSGTPDQNPLVQFAVGNSVNRTDTGMASGGGYATYVYSASTVGVSLPAGSYLLSILDNTSADHSVNWYWSTSALAGAHFERPSAPGAWTQQPDELAFNISGTVVPETAPSVSLALAAFFLVANHVRRKLSTS